MGRLLDEDVVIKEIASWREACKDTSHFETASDLMLVIKAIKGLSSVQLEIIHCCECRHRDPEDKKCDCGHDIIWQLPRGDDWYCADAERRTNDYSKIYNKP